ncbi:hypothetical protein NUM3379_26160 [Kineococcus sp. NUM-3379]
MSDARDLAAAVRRRAAGTPYTVQDTAGAAVTAGVVLTTALTGRF